MQRTNYASEEQKAKKSEDQRKRYADTEYRKNKKTKQRAYSKTPKGREIRKRIHAKKRREFGLEPINEWFPNSDAHHINKNQVVYIPTAIHEAHYGHRLDRSETMIEINRVAFQYLTETIKQL
ncbi:MAG: hypothetical protein WA130_11310 [Candidatus Methanoperedens sp.]